MKIHYQVASSDFLDWNVVDSKDWTGLGCLFINAICVQGDIWQGYDVYGVKNLSNGALEVVGCCDSKDWPPGTRWARVVKYVPLGPDPRPEYGGAINSYKITEIYADNFSAFSYHKKDSLCCFKPWEDLYLNRYCCKNGIWLSDKQFDDLDKKRSKRSWREWGEHLSVEELDKNGLVLDQSSLGRKVEPKGTQTFIMRTGTSFYYAHTAQKVHSILKGFGTEDTTVASDITGDETLFIFCAKPGAPWVAHWPNNGVYRCQIDVSSATTDLAYGLKNFGSSPGHFGRTSKEHGTCLQAIQQAEASFTGSGLKLATITNPSWSLGSHFDQLEILIAGTRTTGHSKQSLTLRLNRPDDYIDGPWEPVPCVTQAMLVF